MTNEIKHHVTDEILMAYSAGALPEAFDLVIATHVSLCDECRARMDGFDAVGGAVLDECDAVAMSADSLSATMAMIAEADQNHEEARVAKTGSVFPAPLQEYVNGDLDAVKWRNLGGGVRQAILGKSKDASVRLLHIPAGAAMPDHGHRGMEMTLVLKGAFRDQDGRYARGDVEIADEDLHHTPIAEDGEDCICLAATDAPLKFNAFIPRIAQPFFRI